MMTAMFDQHLKVDSVKVGVGIDRLPNRQAPFETACTKPAVNIFHLRSTATDLQASVVVFPLHGTIALR
jgi:hypothetical protein